MKELKKKYFRHKINYFKTDKICLIYMENIGS